jgi:heme/copper-type cytochrome/quinol oxidase subunit 3
MNKLHRYNLGFKWFGPLEQCQDGFLMKASEVDQAWQIAKWEYEHRISYLQNQLNETTLRLNSASTLHYELHQSHEKLKKHVRHKRFAIIGLGLLFIGIAIIKWHS